MYTFENRMPMGTEHEDPSKSAIALIKHSFWGGVAFVGIILVAVALELLERFLLRFSFIEGDTTLTRIIHLGSLVLATLDVLFLVGVVGKTGWQFLRKL